MQKLSKRMGHKPGITNHPFCAVELQFLKYHHIKSKYEEKKQRQTNHLIGECYQMRYINFTVIFQCVKKNEMNKMEL